MRNIVCMNLPKQFCPTQVCWQFFCDAFHLLHDALKCSSASIFQYMFAALCAWHLPTIRFNIVNMVRTEDWTSSAISKPSPADVSVFVYGCVVLWPQESISGIFFRFSHARQKTGPPCILLFCPEKRYEKKTNHLVTE